MEDYDRKVDWKKAQSYPHDNGGEFTSREFKSYLETEGVRPELTIPHNPEQNGVAECMNRMLVETARSMLVNSNLPYSFWAEALLTATCVIEVLPRLCLR